MSADGFPTTGEIAQAVDVLDGLRGLHPSEWADVHYTNLQHSLGVVMPILRARRDRAQDELADRDVSTDGGATESEDVDEVLEVVDRLADMVTNLQEDVGQMSDRVDTVDGDVTDLLGRVEDLEGAA